MLARVCQRHPQKSCVLLMIVSLHLFLVKKADSKLWQVSNLQHALVSQHPGFVTSLYTPAYALRTGFPAASSGQGLPSTSTCAAREHMYFAEGQL